MIEWLVAEAILLSSAFGIIGSVLLSIPALNGLRYRRLFRNLLAGTKNVQNLEQSEVVEIGDRVTRTQFLEGQSKWIIAGVVCLLLALIFLGVDYTQALRE